MTIKARGIKHIEFIREDWPTNPNYTGRTLRLMPESGGELLLDLTAKQVFELYQTCRDECDTFRRKNSHWVNKDCEASWPDWGR